MTKTALKLLMFFCCCACNRGIAQVNENTKRNIDSTLGITGDQENIVFKAREIVPAPSTKHSYIGTFEFKNNSQRAIMLTGFPSPRVGTYRPHAVEFEVKESNGWTKLDIGYCGFHESEISIAANSECLLVIDLGSFKESRGAVDGRVRLGKYTSDSFVLDWARDESKGLFKLARQTHLNKLRRLMRDAGFKHSETSGEDFYKQLLFTLLSPTDSDDLGFDPFLGDLDFIPVESSGGNLRIDFHGSVMVEYEYQYSGLIYLNPATFTPEWYRTIMPNHVAIGAWGNARSLKLDDGSAFYTDANKLYIEIKYHARLGQQLPGIDASKKIFTQMLSKFGDCLETSPE